MQNGMFKDSMGRVVNKNPQRATEGRKVEKRRCAVVAPARPPARLGHRCTDHRLITIDRERKMPCRCSFRPVRVRSGPACRRAPGYFGVRAPPPSVGAIDCAKIGHMYPPTVRPGMPAVMYHICTAKDVPPTYARVPDQNVRPGRSARACTLFMYKRCT